MAVISLDIFVDRLDDVLAVFNRLQVHRSITGALGVYEEITDPAGPTSAMIDGTEVAPLTISGETLEVTVDGASAPVQVTFTGVDPLTFNEILTQIEAVDPALASEVPTDTDQLRLTSPTDGTGSSLEVTDNAAATALGLSTDKVNGKAARVTLVSPTSDYNFRDLDGADTYFYKTRYSSTTGATLSAFSEPRQGSLDTILPVANLSKAKIYLTTGVGKPVVDRHIRFVPMAVNNPSGTDYYLIPGTDARIEVMTNELGYAEAFLVREVTYRVFFEGTDYGREFEVPDETEFFLLPLLGTSPDPFDIVQTPPMPIKVS